MITLGELRQYPKLYAAAVENFKAINSKTKDWASLGHMQMWGRTPEGRPFWTAVWEDDFDLAKSLHPELFEEDVADITAPVLKELPDNIVIEPKYDSIQIGTKKPEPEEPKPLSYLRNDKEREEAREVSDKIFRKRYVP